VPQRANDLVASAKLASMGGTIDEMTEHQKKYTTSWQHGGE